MTDPTRPPARLAAPEAHERAIAGIRHALELMFEGDEAEIAAWWARPMPLCDGLTPTEYVREPDRAERLRRTLWAHLAGNW